MKLFKVMKGENSMQQGKIVTLSGISGIGKSFLKSYILANNSNFQSLISVTTRNRRTNETEGVDKFFYSLEEFEKERNSDRLCVENEVFGNWYAYKKSQIELCNCGINLITELFYKNVHEFKMEFSNALSVYVLPNDIERTKRELKARELEAKDLNKRLKDIDDDLTFFYSNRNLFDIVITNDYTEKSCLLLQQLIEQEIRSD